MSAKTFLSALMLLCGLVSTQTIPPATRPAGTQPEYRLDQWDLKSLGGKFQPAVERITGGEIDWTAGAVYAVGTGRLRGNSGSDLLMAQRAARVVALRSALLLTAGIRVGPGGRFADFKEGRIDLEGVVKDFQEVDSDYDVTTNTVISKVKVPLGGAHSIVSLSPLVLQRPEKLWRWPDKGELHIAHAQYVIIDARGTPFRPCLLPRLLNTTGESVFDAGSVYANGLPVQGAVRYVTLDAKLSTAEVVAERIKSRDMMHSIVLTVSKVTDRDEIMLDDQQLGTLGANATKESLEKPSPIIPSPIIIVVDAPRPPKRER